MENASKEMKLGRNEYLDLAKRILLMCDIFNRKLGDEALAFWGEELAPVYGESLFAALREGMRKDWMPGVDWVLNRTAELNRKANPISPDEQERLRWEKIRMDEAGL